MSKIIKVEYKKGYTVIDNTFLRDENLDITERGLLVTMLSLPEDWDYKGTGLTAILPCGKNKVFNSLKKLEEAGYIKRTFIYRNGRIVDCEYQICGNPVFREGKNEDVNCNLETNGEITCNNTDEESTEKVGYDDENDLNKKVIIKSKISFDTTNADNCAEADNNFICPKKILYTEKQETEIGEYNKVLKKELTNDKYISNQSINPIYNFQERMIDMMENIFKTFNNILEKKNSEYSVKNSHCKKKESYVDNCAEDYYKYVEIIKDNIEYDLLLQRDFKYNSGQLDEMVQIMAETCAFNKKFIKISGNFIPAEIVKSRLLKLTAQEIEYVKECIDNCKSDIRNIKAYMIAALYNSKSTVENYYTAAVAGL